MPKMKKVRIAAVKDFPNVSHDAASLKGKWTEIFQNDFPIVLELGCGKGDYTLNLARKYPDKNFIGIDLKGYRLWKAASTALDDNLQNVFFLRANVLDLGDVFDPGSVSSLWITFPDPYPKKPRKRMTAERYLDVYKKICRPGSLINFKTDDDALYDWSLESIMDYGCHIQQNLTDVHSDEAIDDELKILTYYEKQHIVAGLKIKYLQFTLPQEV
jgi:tRNA (guanine-N7-)-methyltransferase